MSKRMMKRLLACLFIIATGLTTNVSATSYEFRRTISREVLENYLSKSITVADIMWFRSDMAGPVLNMIKNIHAKFLGRAILTWGGEQVIDQLMDTAAPLVTVVHNADADVIVQGCIFEIITQNVNQVPIPAWVFQEFDLPVERISFFSCLAN